MAMAPTAARVFRVNRLLIFVSSLGLKIADAGTENAFTLTGGCAAPARAVSFVGLLQVLLHGFAGGAAVVRLDGLHHCLVFCNGGLP
jgi:hypothetical protein